MEAATLETVPQGPKSIRKSSLRHTCNRTEWETIAQENGCKTRTAHPTAKQITARLSGPPAKRYKDTGRFSGGLFQLCRTQKSKSAKQNRPNPRTCLKHNGDLQQREQTLIGSLLYTNIGTPNCRTDTALFSQPPGQFNLVVKKGINRQKTKKRKGRNGRKGGKPFPLPLGRPPIYDAVLVHPTKQVHSHSGKKVYLPVLPCHAMSCHFPRGLGRGTMTSCQTCPSTIHHYTGNLEDGRWK